MNKTLIIISVLGMMLGFHSTVFAGPDANQQMIIKRIQESKLKLKAAEAAQNAERQKLMDEHMKMMAETMEKMRNMTPRKGMTMQEHEEWMDEHQKLMQQVMEQMMDDHHALMRMKCM
jgi:acyl transferase domain-containing protein